MMSSSIRRLCCTLPDVGFRAPSRGKPGSFKQQQGVQGLSHLFCDRLQRGDEQDHLIREQVQVAPEENGQNLLRIGGGQLAAAKLQPRSHLNIPCSLIICCDKGKDAILSVTFDS